MEWLNYHHLFYFWKVVRAGGITRACRELRLAPPTISAQLRTLEEHLGEPLLIRSGRTLVPTEVGRMVYGYAEEIFGLGQELLDAVKQRPTGRPLRLVIGVDDVLPKEIAYRLIEPALRLPEPVRLRCQEGTLEKLVADLAMHELDLVLSDAPVTPSLNVRAYNHLLGESGVVFVAPPRLAASCRRRFPHSLSGAPVLLPTLDTAIRRDLDVWFETQNLRPVIVGEFEDYALLRVFGEEGAGILPVPQVLQADMRRRGLHRVGAARGVRAHFYAISMERRMQHPALLAIWQAARRELFAGQ
jgi:LysR family transcriptional activator of nhaA